MRTERQRRLGEDPLEVLLTLDQQVAGAGADEDLDARRPAGVLQFLHVLRRGTDVEAVVHQASLGG